MGLTLVNGIFVTGGTGVDAWGHLGGLISGICLGLFMQPEAKAGVKAASLIVLCGTLISLAVVLHIRSLGQCDKDPVACASICGSI